MKSLSRGRFALSPGRWRIVRRCKPHPASGVPQVYPCRAYFRTVLPGCTYCSTAVVLLWWWVSRWVRGGWWVLDVWRLACDLRDGGRVVKQLTSPRFLPCCGCPRLRNQLIFIVYRYTAVHTAALLYCCSGVVDGWWGCTWVGRTCYISWVCFRACGRRPRYFFLIRVLC